jgi:peptidoglycan/LPS O-acetylase OafA/YrhL
MPVRVDNGGMRARFLAIGAAVWTAANAGIYFVVISAQGNNPAWWYLAVLGAATLLFALAAGRLWPVPMLITGAILLTGAALAGVLLVPGVLAAVAALGPTRHPQAGHPGARMHTG